MANDPIITKAIPSDEDSGELTLEANDGDSSATSLINKPNREITKPNAIMVKPVRNQASNVRSAAKNTRGSQGSVAIFYLNNQLIYTRSDTT